MCMFSGFLKVRTEVDSFFFSLLCKTKLAHKLNKLPAMRSALSSRIQAMMTHNIDYGVFLFLHGFVVVVNNLFNLLV